MINKKFVVFLLVCLNLTVYGQNEVTEDTVLAVPTLSDTLRAIPTQPLSVLPSSDCKLDGYERRKLLSKTQWAIVAQKRTEIDFMRSRIDSLYYVEAMLNAGNKQLELLEKSLLYNKFFIPSVVEKIRFLIGNSSTALNLDNWEKIFSFWKSSVDFLYHSDSIQKITQILWQRSIDEMNMLNKGGKEQQALELYYLLKKYYGSFSYDIEKEKSILNNAHSGIFKSYVSVAERALHRGLEGMAQNYALKAHDYYSEYSDNIEADNSAKKILFSIVARYRAFASLSDDDEKIFYLSQIDSIYRKIDYPVEIVPPVESSVPDESTVLADNVSVAETPVEVTVYDTPVASPVAVAEEVMPSAANAQSIANADTGIYSSEDNIAETFVEKQPESAVQEQIVSELPSEIVEHKPATAQQGVFAETDLQSAPTPAPPILVTATAPSPSSSQQHKRLTPQLKKQIESILDSARILRLERKFYPAHFLFEKAYKLYPQAASENAVKDNLTDAVEQLLNKAQYQLWNSKANVADSLYRQAIELCNTYETSTNAAITVLFTNYLFKRKEILCRQFSLSVVSEEKRYARIMLDGKLNEGLQGLKRLREEIRAEDCFADTTVLMRHIRVGDSAQAYYSLKKAAMQALMNGDTLGFINKYLRADTLYLKGFFSEYVSDFKPLMRYLEQGNEFSIMEKWLLSSIQKNDLATAVVLMEKIRQRSPKSKVLKKLKGIKELKNESKA